MATEASTLEQAQGLLSYKELRMIEGKSGTRLANLDDPNADILAFMQAMHWVLAKREDPTVSYDDLDDAKPDELAALVDRLTPGKAS